MNDPKQKIYEQIEDYLSGELKGESLSDFKARLKEDPKLAASVKLHREVATAIASESAEQAFKKIVKEESLVFAPVKTAKVRKLGFLKWAVAAAILLAVVGLFVLQQIGEPEGASSSELFAMAYQAPPSPLERSAGDLDAAYAAYAEKKYAAAVQLFEKSATQEQRSEDKYFMAISYISAEKPDLSKAIQLLDQVSRDENSFYQSAAKWYMAMAILKVGDKDIAKRLLEEIAKGGPTNYKQKAVELLENY